MKHYQTCFIAQCLNYRLLSQLILTISLFCDEKIKMKFELFSHIISHQLIKIIYSKK